jgi:hypothetical protein
MKGNHLAARREARGTGFGGRPHPVRRTERTCSEIGTTVHGSQEEEIFFCLGSTVEPVDNTDFTASKKTRFKTMAKTEARSSQKKNGFARY